MTIDYQNKKEFRHVFYYITDFFNKNTFDMDYMNYNIVRRLKLKTIKGTFEYYMADSLKGAPNYFELTSK